MESTIKETSSVKRELEVVLTADEFNPYLNRVLTETQKKVQLKGFRKGKVPLSVVQKMYGKSLEAEAIEEAIQKSFEAEATEKHLHPVGVPSVTQMDRTKEGGLNFTILYEILPKFELGSYKGISARKLYHLVSLEEVEGETNRILEQHMTPETVNAAEDENHLITVDMAGIDENDEVIDGTGQKDFRIFLKRDGLNPALKEKLIGAKLDDVFTIALPTGEDETPMNYRVTVKDIQQITLPELNDEFAAKLTGDEQNTVADLQDMIKQSIEAEYESRYARMFRDELVAKLVESHDFEVPDTLVVDTLNRFVEDVKEQNKDKKLPADFDREKFFQEMHPVAIRTVKWALIRDKIIDAEELIADEADFEGLAKMEAERTGIDYETLLGYFKRTASTEDRIISEKALQLIEDYAIVEEVEDLVVMEQQKAEREQSLKAAVNNAEGIQDAVVVEENDNESK